MTDSKTQDTGNIDVAYIARLARLNLTDEETRTFQGQLEHIVEYVRKINQLDLTEVEPMSLARPVLNVFRKDETRPGLDRRKVLENAPAHSNGQFIVPKIVE